MAHRPSGLSRTLPKNFTFPLSLEGREPKTPEHHSIKLRMPSAPRPASCRAFRPRVNTQTSLLPTPNELNIFSFTSADVPLPSIEFPPGSDMLKSSYPLEEPVLLDHLQVPLARRMMFKTPPAQIGTNPLSFPGAGRWVAGDRLNVGLTLERPGSACSDSSASSIDTINTLTTQPSLGGSCTSPESDIHDPFSFHAGNLRKRALELSPSRPEKVTESSPHWPRTFPWTVEMDNHLWNTYQIYLQDPTITPFKMVPGRLPPLGISHQVAREAKRTWVRAKTKPNRSSSHPISSASCLPDAATVMTSDRMTLESRSVTPTPTITIDPAAKPNWPRSEAATRRRLKFLCKRKFSIAPHYQRLLQSRTPSPFLGTPPRPLSSRRFSRQEAPSRDQTAFATRDLGVSLVSSTLPDALPQLAAADHPYPPGMTNNCGRNVAISPMRRDYDPHATPMPSSIHVDPIPRLGSPFKYNTWGPDNSRRPVRSATPVNRHDTMHVTGSRLRSPVRRDAPSSAYKRRAAQPSLELSPNAAGVPRSLQDICRGKLKDGQRRVRIRNRGNTTGAFNSREQLEQLFSPPPQVSAPSSNDPARSQFLDVRNSLQSDGGSIRRLGSPFKLNMTPLTTPLSRYPRHAPSLSDPFINGSLYANPSLDCLFPRTREQSGSAVPPHDPTEAGISDAERIRRQILNLPFTRR